MTAKNVARIYVPLMIVLSAAALLFTVSAVTPIQAAPKVATPSWTVSQNIDELGQKLVVVEGFLPANRKGDYAFLVDVMLGNNCQHLYNCGGSTCEFNCPAGTTCNWLYVPSIALEVNDRMGTEQGAGWTIVAERTRSGLAFTLTLTNEHFIGRDFYQVNLSGYSILPGYPSEVSTSTSTEEGFGYSSFP